MSTPSDDRAGAPPRDATQPWPPAPPDQPSYYGQPGQPAQHGQPGQPVQHGQPGQPVQHGQPGQAWHYGQPGQAWHYGQPGQAFQYGPQGPPLPARKVKASPLPSEPTAYPQLLRSPRYRWWRPLVAIALFGAFLTVALIAVFGVALALGTIFDFAAFELLEQVGTPFGFALLIGSLVILIPVSMLSIRIAFGTPVGYVVSVTGRFRLGWALRCAAVVTPVWIVLMVISYFDGSFTGGRPEQWLILMVMVVLFIPFQAAGEEFAFRGFVQQVVGSWFPNPWLALIVPGILSVPLFAAAHGSFDGWVLADLSVSAAAWVYLTWRTGGLEAGIAVHAVNNCLIMLASLALGGFEDGFVTETTTGSWDSLAITVASTAVAVALIVWQARRVGVQRLLAPDHRGSGVPLATTSANQ